jgi:hypothetical protein
MSSRASQLGNTASRCLWIVVCSLAAACSTDRAPAPAPGSTTMPTPAPPPAVPASPQPPFNGTMGPVVVERPGARVAEVRDVRAGGHANFDRIVLELLEPVPSYRVEYLAGPATDCGSGEVVPVEGSARLNVVLQPARGHDDNYQPTINLRSLTPDLAAVVQMKRTCDFEAVYAWVIGTRAQRPFQVHELSDPPRLVIDIAH